MSKQLLNRTDTLAAVHNGVRTETVLAALREHLNVTDNQRVQAVASVYYDAQVSFDQLRALVGSERAASHRVLKRQLDPEFVDKVTGL